MLHFPSPEQAARMRGFFRESEYSTKTLMGRFGANDISSVHMVQLYRRTADFEPTRLNLLLQWFWIGKDVLQSSAFELIPRDILSAFLACGLLQPEADRFRSQVRIAPFADYFIVSDQAESDSRALRSDTILWPNPTTLLCYHLAMRARVGRTLDLGTGSGILAIVAASHSGSVMATDLNPRAEMFLFFNAALNGVSNIEFAAGSAFEPVGGECFDLILANPPFFVSPTVRRIYSDNDIELDGFCRKLIREAPKHLNAGGYCQMLLEWVQVEGQPWRERLASWMEGLGCDVWVITTYARTAADYAVVRVEEDRDEIANLDAQARLTSQWNQYFKARRVESIFGGMVTLRRREGRNWLRMEELPVRPERPFGDYLRRVFESREFLEIHPATADLLSTRPVLERSCLLQKHYSLAAEGWRMNAIDLRVGEGLPYTIALQPGVADFLGSCDGSRTLEALTSEMAGEAGVALETVREECCAVVRQLAERGILFFH